MSGPQHAELVARRADGEASTRNRTGSIVGRATYALLPLVLILGAALALRVHLRVGCIGSDDIATWHTADAISEGRLAPDEFIQNPIAGLRYGLALPAALCIRLWGNNESVLLIYPIFMSLLGIVAVWDVVRRATECVGAAHFAAAMLAVTSLDIHYATVFLPDGPMAAWGWIAIWCAVVGIEIDARFPRAAAVFMTLCGLICAFSMMHKVSAAQLVGGVAIWGLVLAIGRRFTPRLWWIVAGFLVGLDGELVLMYLAYGDPLHRWRTIISVSADNVARREEVATHGVAMGERIAEWLLRLVQELPSFSMIAALAVFCGLMCTVRRGRSIAASLVIAYLFSIAAMRGLELTQTYSYQPRRLLPLAGCAAVLSACLFWGRRGESAASRRGPALVCVVLLACQAGLFVFRDVGEIRKESRRLDTERWAYQWMSAHAEKVRRFGLYVDHRTFKSMTALSGFDALKDRGVHLYASSVADSYALYGRRHTSYREGAFFLENLRVMEWLMPYAHREAWFKIYAELPKNWTLLDVSPPDAGGCCGGALYRVGSSASEGSIGEDSTGPGSTPNEGSTPIVVNPFANPGGASCWDEGERMFGGWYVWGGDESLRIGPLAASGDPSDGITVEFSGRGPQLSSAGGVSKPPSTNWTCRKGEYVIVRFPVGFSADADSQGWARYRFRIIGYDAGGKRLDLDRGSSGRLYYERQELRAYIQAPVDVHGIRLYLRFFTPGRYEIHPPRVTHYRSMPVASGV